MYIYICKQFKAALTNQASNPYTQTTHTRIVDCNIDLIVGRQLLIINRPSDRRGTEKKLDTAMCVRNVDHQSVCNSG